MLYYVSNPSETEPNSQIGGFEAVGQLPINALVFTNIASTPEAANRKLSQTGLWVVPEGTASVPILAVSFQGCSPFAVHTSTDLPTRLLRE